MATELFTFGVKYRLDVSDVEGCLWRIDIEEKDYVGSVTNFIGDGSAFEITWENNENYDKAIIGSFARISIMAKPVLDVGTPDFTELFTTDENKFRVKIYYDPTFAVLKDNFSLYWQGFIVQDDYIEEVNSDPYKIQIVATENFGKLRSFAFNDNDPSKHEEYYTPAEILYDSLTNIGLAIDVNDLSGYKLNEEPATFTEPFCETINLLSAALLKSDSYKDCYSMFEAVESYLKSINCFLVQAFGELYIVSKASYHSILNGNFDPLGFKLTFGASAFSSASILASSIPLQELDIPSDFRVIDRSLIKTRKSAAQAVISDYKLKPRNLFYNGSFELDSVSDGINQKIAGWFGKFDTTLPLEPIAIPFNTSATSSGTGEKSAIGNLQDSPSAFEGADAATRNTTYTEWQTSTDYTQDPLGNTINPFATGIPYTQNHSSGEDYELQGELKFKVFIPQGVASEPIQFRYSIMWSRGVLAAIYYDFDNGTWSTDHTYGTETISEVGSWEEISKTIAFEVTDDTSTQVGDVVFRVHVVTPEGAVPVGAKRYYLDDVSLKVFQPEGNDSAISKGTNSFSVGIEEGDNTLGSEITEEDVLFGVTKFYDSAITPSDDLLERADLISDRVGEQYYSVDANEVVDVKWYYDRDPLSEAPTYNPRTQSLQQWVNEHRWDEVKTTQSFLQGNLKNVTNVNGGTYKPITPLDVLSMSFRNGAYDTDKYLITRLSINPRLNLVNFVAKNIVVTDGDYVVPSGEIEHLLLETGGFLLLENGDKLILE